MFAMRSPSPMLTSQLGPAAALGPEGQAILGDAGFLPIGAK